MWFLSVGLPVVRSTKTQCVNSETQFSSDLTITFKLLKYQYLLASLLCTYCWYLLQQPSLATEIIKVLCPLLFSALLSRTLFATQQLCVPRLAGFGEGSSTMRDRLEELQQRAQDFSEAASVGANPFSAEGDNGDSVDVGVITPQAVVFEEEPIIENFLSEAQQIRDDITVLETEVISLSCWFLYAVLTLLHCICCFFGGFNSLWRCFLNYISTRLIWFLLSSILLFLSFFLFSSFPLSLNQSWLSFHAFNCCVMHLWSEAILNTIVV